MAALQALVRFSVVALPGIAAFGQSTPAKPTFDAADVHATRSINPTPEVTGGVLRDGRYELRQATMLDLIAMAWGVDADTVLGGPSWLQWDRFDIAAKAPPDTSREKVRLMLQALLADRFGLAVRKDTKPLPAFALTAGGGKLKLRPAEGADGGACGTKRDPGSTPMLAVSCRNMTVEEFAQNLRGLAAPLIGKPVVDRSGLEGHWDFDFRFTPWSAATAQARGDGITIFDALEKQLGLKLELQKAPAPVLVVDRVNRTPTDNLSDVAGRLPPSRLTQFEVAVIKPSLPETTPDLRLQPGGEVDMKGIALKTLIALAWHLDPDANYMIAGAPKFLDSSRFDIIARPPTGGGPRSAAPLDVDELRVLLQDLLKDRFKLTMHMEDRTVPAYSLVAAKPKLKRADTQNPARWKEGPGPDGKDPRLTNPMLSRLVTFQSVTIAQFADALSWIGSGLPPGPILDETGLKGSWDFTLSFSSAGLLPHPANSGGVGQTEEPNGAVSISDAIEKQLGLKLEMRKRAIPVLVIDHIEEKPTDN